MNSFSKASNIVRFCVIGMVAAFMLCTSFLQAFVFDWELPTPSNQQREREERDKECEKARERVAEGRGKGKDFEKANEHRKNHPTCNGVDFSDNKYSCHSADKD